MVMGSSGVTCSQKAVGASGSCGVLWQGSVVCWTSTPVSTHARGSRAVHGCPRPERSGSAHCSRAVGLVICVSKREGSALLTTPALGMGWGKAGGVDMDASWACRSDGSRGLGEGEVGSAH